MPTVPLVRRALFLVLACLLLAAAEAPPGGSSRGSAPSDPPRGDLRFVVFGDFNGPYGSLTYPAPVARAVRAISEVWRPDLLLSPGDVVAGQKASLSDWRREAMWEAFDREVAVPLRAVGIPYAVAMGNHDASSLRDADGGFRFARDRDAAAAYWGRPMYDANLSYVDRVGHPFTQAFRAGEAFVAILDASDARIGDAQLAWLDAMLDRPEAISAGVRIVVGHLPLLPVGRGRDAPGEYLADASAARLRGVLEAGCVDLYVSGHQAAYYPGRLGDLELLFTGGVGARALLAGDAPPRSTVTVVDVWFEPRAVRYTTFDVATMEVVPVDTLPPTIGEGAQEVRLSGWARPVAAGAATGVAATEVNTQAERGSSGAATEARAVGSPKVVDPP